MSGLTMTDMNAEELASLVTGLRKDLAEAQARGQKLDLTRGKPSTAQLDLSDRLLHLPASPRAADGTDTRNYGGLAGLPELRAIFAELLGVEVDQLVAGGNASLSMMRDVLVNLWLKGAIDGERPWGAEPGVKFLCPVPGYDRHFSLLEWFGIEMIPVPLNDDGPDVAVCARLVADDPSIKGMWVVPTYANPSGAVCSLEVADALVSMPTAAPDFKILWDNAYAFHHLTSVEAKSADVVTLAAVAGHPHRPIMFASTSKITWAGAGVAFLAGSRENVRWYLDHLGMGTIGPDKVNQLRHVEFFGSAQGVVEHMARHREILVPKFDVVDAVLSERLSGHGVATWTRPAGGYFVSLDVLDGTAARVVSLAKEAGVALTPAGSSFPYREDPRDRNIRLAPSYPTVDEVRQAMDIVATCVLLAAAEQFGGAAVTK